jgi:hypothetical protein
MYCIYISSSKIVTKYHKSSSIVSTIPFLLPQTSQSLIYRHTLLPYPSYSSSLCSLPLALCSQPLIFSHTLLTYPSYSSSLCSLPLALCSQPLIFSHTLLPYPSYSSSLCSLPIALCSQPLIFSHTLLTNPSYPYSLCSFTLLTIPNSQSHFTHYPLYIPVICSLLILLRYAQNFLYVLYTSTLLFLPLLTKL